LGLRYLEALFKAELPPALILISRTLKLSDMAISTVKERTGGRFVWKSLEELLVDRPIPAYFVGNHNSKITATLLRNFHVDLAVLGGVGIIKRHVLAIPKMGIINVHPGILPKYRGSSAVEWAIYNNDPVGATCHFVTEEIDAGKIIYKTRIKIIKGDKYEDVRLKAYDLQPIVLIRGLRILMRPNYRASLKPNSTKSYFHPMNQQILQEVKNMLKERIYSHYV